MKNNLEFMENNYYISDVSKKQKIIHEIQERNGNFRYIEQANSLFKLLNVVSEDIYSDPNRFIIEFIQNCDDSAQLKKKLDLEILINEKKHQICFCYNGKEFTEEDTKAICAAGKSTKISDINQTGYKGIGFKSVFANSNKVVIISKGFQFKFDKEECLTKMAPKYQARKENFDFPWQYYPIWTELKDLDKNILKFINKFSVNIIIDICDKTHFDECKQTILELQENQAYLLFLKSKNICIKAYDIENNEYYFKIKKIKDSNQEDIFYFMQEKDKYLEKFFIKDYLIDLKKENIDLNLLYNEDTKLPNKLKDVTNVDMAFAAKLKPSETIKYKNFDFEDDEEEELNINNINFEKTNVISDLSTETFDEVIALESHKRFIYSYLPTKVNFNFPFLVNSNFILDAGRGQLKDNEFNRLLISLLPYYISKFYNDVKEQFGNSYANILFKDYKIDTKSFFEVFKKNMEIEFTTQKNNGITVFCKEKNQKNRIEKIFYDNFCPSLKLDNKKFKQITDFFENIYSEGLTIDKINQIEKNIKEEINNNNICVKLENEDYDNKTNNLIDIKQECIFESIHEYNEMEKENKCINLGKNLIEDFIKNEYNIELVEENSISKKEKNFIDKIKAHYEISYLILDEDIFYKFIKSMNYSDNYSHNFAYKLVKLLKEKDEILKKIKNEGAYIFKDKNGDLCPVDKLFFYNLKNKDDYIDNFDEKNLDLTSPVKEKNSKKRDCLNNISMSDKKKLTNDKKNENKSKFGDKSPINEDLFTLFFINNDIIILQKLGLKEFSDNCQLDEILLQIDNEYDKRNSFFFIKILLRKWYDFHYNKDMNIDKKDKNHMMEKIIDKVKNRNLLTKSNKFLHPHCVILGKEFTKLDDFDSYEDYHLNSKYVDPKIEMKFHIEFFEKAELWVKKKDFYIPVLKENFQDYPFIQKEFIEIFKNDKKIFSPKLKNLSPPIFISPELNSNFYKNSIKFISGFFEKYSNYLRDLKPLIVNKTNFNYFKWFFDNNGKIIPTNKSNLKKVEDVYSYDILIDKPEEIKKLFLEFFEFPYNEALYQNLKVYDFKKELEPNDINKLLTKLYENYTKSTCIQKKSEIKNIYLLYLIKFSKTLSSFDGLFLDSEYEFVKPENCFYLATSSKNEIIEDKILKDYKKLLIPENDFDVENFLKFANLNKCRIYYDKDFKYTSISPSKDKDFEKFLDNLEDYIHRLIKNSKNYSKNLSNTLKEIREQIKKIEIYYCSQIKLELKKQIFPHGISFSKVEKLNLKIYYLKDDEVYTSFRHPTIAYYISYFICNFLKIPKLKEVVMPIIMMLGRDDEINNFINNIIHE